jgi:tetratricopeptide (TPR) repeat protein
MKKFYFLGSLLLAGVVIAWKQSAERPADIPVKEKGRSPIYFCSPSFDPAKVKEDDGPLFKGLGNLHFAVSTKNKKAQQYFNQGLTLVYAFNHGEAGRSFSTALKLDPTLAMGYWGLAMVLGPNYNAPLNPSKLEDINAAMDKAIQYASNASAKEQALIHALAKRFPREEVKDVSPYTAAYATAMKEVYEKFPDDADVLALYADALMNEHPWNFWLKDGTAQPWTAQVIGVLEKALAKFPNHPGINHSYIHAIEGAPHPEKGLVSAKRLEKMLPAAGHLVHMPSHIYIRTGDYHQGVLVNEWSTEADSTYVAQCKVEGVYPLMYYPHNIHFLAACAFFEGNSRKAIDAAWMVSRKADKRYILENATVQHYYMIPFYVMVQMAKWDDILRQPAPGESLKYPVAVWHYARGMAFGAKGKLLEAEQELTSLKKIAGEESLKSLLIWETNSAAELVNIAVNVLTAEIAMHQSKYEKAIEHFKKAIAIEDALMYQEPPDWFFSVRQSLGHVLLLAKKFEEAEKVYKEDLKMYRENGWSLMGLYQSLMGQAKENEAKEVKKRFDKAWAHADISINSSRKY